MPTPEDTENEERISDEVCEAEFHRFAEGMDLDVDPKHLDDEDKKSLDESKRRFFRAMKMGQLTVNAECEPVFTPADGGKAIVFHEPKGASFMASDQKKKGHDMAKTFAQIADMTGQSPDRFAKMAGRDVKVCVALYLLFMGG
jgi:hypothetical protein